MALEDTLADLMREVAELKRIVPNLITTGTVAEVDAERGTVRLQYGEDADGKAILGPAIPWQEQGGAFRSFVPPSVGQIMTAINPVGDPRQGMAVNGAFSNHYPAPGNKADENAFAFGPWKISLSGGVLNIEGPRLKVKGNVEIEGNADFSNGHVKSNGKHIDSTHRHTDVMPGPALTGTPS
jgi:phage baseplate assembly protein gpV